MRLSGIFLLSVFVLSACSGNGETVEGKYEMWINRDNLSVYEITVLKGRCLIQLIVEPKEQAAETAATTIGRNLAASIPLDGSAPASDSALVALVPAAEDLPGWEEDTTDQVDGPWLVTTDAFAWIDGAAAPFDENGFEAVAGETYNHTTEGWQLKIAVVNQGSVAGAEAAFRGANWDTGERIE